MTLHLGTLQLRAVGTFRELYQASLRETPEEDAVVLEDTAASDAQLQSSSISSSPAASSPPDMSRRESSEARRSSDASKLPFSFSQRQARQAKASGCPIAFLRRLRSRATDALKHTQLVCRSSATRCVAWLQEAVGRVRTEL